MNLVSQIIDDFIDSAPDHAGGRIYVHLVTDLPLVCLHLTGYFVSSHGVFYGENLGKFDGVPSYSPFFLKEFLREGIAIATTRSGISISGYYNDERV